MCIYTFTTWTNVQYLFSTQPPPPWKKIWIPIWKEFSKQDRVQLNKKKPHFLKILKIIILLKTFLSSTKKDNYYQGRTVYRSCRSFCDREARNTWSEYLGNNQGTVSFPNWLIYFSLVKKKKAIKFLSKINQHLTNFMFMLKNMSDYFFSQEINVRLDYWNKKRLQCDL